MRHYSEFWIIISKSPIPTIPPGGPGQVAVLCSQKQKLTGYSQNDKHCMEESANITKHAIILN